MSLNFDVSGPLIQTKLFRPVLRAARLHRAALIDRLNKGLGMDAGGFTARMTLISAAAGFGKTTLVYDWLGQLAQAGFTDLRSAWLSLDENENDLVRFLIYLITALQTAVPGIGETAVPMLKSPEPPPVESVLSLIINDIGRKGQPIILVIEDYHVISAPAVHKALIFLLEHQPHLLHLLLITRSDPPLPLSRLRAGGNLVEIRADDLRFSTEEAGQFFSQVMDLTLTAEEVLALERRTEGWIAGLQLAALSMQGRDDRPAFIAAFTGNNRFILDYLTDEVLAQRPKGTKDFLLQTSILDHFCAPLCTAVTGQRDSQAILERLEGANFFLIALDEERRWYRYHHLFADALRQHLQKSQGDFLPELYWRAMVWFEQNGYIAEAIAQALAGCHYERAAQLIEQAAGDRLRRGDNAILIKWLDALPPQILVEQPRLCLARSWTSLMGPNLSLQDAEDWVDRAQKATAGDHSQALEMAGEVAAQRAMIAAIWGEVTNSIDLAQQALASLPGDSPWRSVTAFTLGSSLFLFGDLIAAKGGLEEALRLSLVDGSLYIQLNAASFLGDILLIEGRLSEAWKSYQQVLSWSDQDIPQKGALMAHAGLAQILYQRNEFEDALIHIQLGLEQLEQVGGAWAALVLYRALAQIQTAQGSIADALASLEQAYQFGRRTQVNIVFTQAAALQTQLRLVQGDLEAAEEWMANCGLSPDDAQASHPGLHEQEYLVLARVLYTRGEFSAAQDLLQRLLQSAESEKRRGSAIFILLLQSLIYQTQDNLAQALQSLSRAVSFAEPEHYVRAFSDEGEPLHKLLHAYRLDLLTQLGAVPDKTTQQHLAYVNDLLLVQPTTGRAVTAFDHSSDWLSERELEVLRLIAAGATNRDIALALYLAVPTVKKHVSNILSKLDVSSRTQAVAEARSLGLI